MEWVLASFQWREEKGNLCLGVAVGGKRESHLPEPLWLHLLSRKDLPWNRVTLALGGFTAQGQAEGGLGQLEPTVIGGPKRKVGRWIHSQSCVQGPLALYNVVKYIISLSKSHFCGSSLKCAIAQALIRGLCQQDVHLFFFLSIHSLQA